MLEVYDMKQLIQIATREDNYRNSSSLIDVISVGKTAKVISSNVISLPENITDHKLVFAVLDMPKFRSPKKTVTYRDYKNINLQHLELDCRATNWNIIYETNNVDEKIYLFNQLILNLLDIHAPVVTKTIKERPFMPWITDTIKTLIKLRNKAHLRYEKNKTEANFNYYKQLRNYTKCAIRREKCAFFNCLKN